MFNFCCVANKGIFTHLLASDSRGGVVSTYVYGIDNQLLLKLVYTTRVNTNGQHTF